MKTRFGTTICAIASRLQDAADYERRAFALPIPRKKGRLAVQMEQDRLFRLARACFAGALEAEEFLGPSMVGLPLSPFDPTNMDPTLEAGGDAAMANANG